MTSSCAGEKAVEGAIARTNRDLGTPAHRRSVRCCVVCTCLRHTDSSHTDPNLLENPIMKHLNRISVLLSAVALTAMVGCASTSKHEGTGAYIDDSVITTKTKTAIFNEPSLKSAEINVETFKGAVQLSGFVSSQANINTAIEVARGVSGVTSVKNDMRLK